MKISTAWNHLKRLTNKVHDAHDWARRLGWTHAALLDKLTDEVWKDAGLKRCPSWVHGILTERVMVAGSNLYRPNLHAAELERMLDRARKGLDTPPVAYLRYAHRLDGREVTTDEISLIAAEAEMRDGHEARIRVWDSVESAHIWNHKGLTHNFNDWESNASRKAKETSNA